MGSERTLIASMNQLPYLDAKHEYFWGSRLVSEVAERDVPILRADKVHTVRSLTGKLLELARLGMADTGFPVLVKEASAHASASASASDRGGGGKRERETGCLRVVGFLGMNELEHALGEWVSAMFFWCMVYCVTTFLWFAANPALCLSLCCRFCEAVNYFCPCPPPTQIGSYRSVSCTLFDSGQTLPI